MKILVCISNVPDTTTKIRFNADRTAFDDSGVQWIINPWDELALTRALELKEITGGAIEKITVVNVGPKTAEPTIRKALAIGADDAVRIDTAAKDSYQVAEEIAAWVRGNPYDVIMCGIDSSDYNGSMVGGMLAEFLDIPSVTGVSGLNIENGDARIKREIDGGQEHLQVDLPVLLVVQKGIAIEPRIPSMRGIMMARNKPLQVVNPVNAEHKSDNKTYDLPESKGACKMIDEDNVDELARVMHEEIKVF